MTIRAFKGANDQLRPNTGAISYDNPYDKNVDAEVGYFVFLDLHRLYMTIKCKAGLLPFF